MIKKVSQFFLSIFELLSAVPVIHFLAIGLVCIWLFHFLGVLVPETGFDAVWYHLPVIARFVQEGRIFFIPDLYQSVNPLFSDLLFGIGYLVGGEYGTKVVAYLFGIGLIFASYTLARHFFSRNWSLLFVLIVSTFQVVAWQSSSFYVDVATALWEVLAVLGIILISEKQKKGINTNGWFVLSGMFIGAALATKLFSIFLLPVFLYGIWLGTRKSIFKSILIFFVSALVISWPFYVYTYVNTGTPFYSFFIHEQKLAEIGGESSPLLYVLKRTAALPASLTQLTLFSRDYTTILFLIFLPLFMLFIPKMWQDLRLRFLLVFGLSQYVLWWYLPPLSTRYALSGFVILLLLFLFAVQKYLKEKPEARKYIFATIILSILLNMLPRIVVAHRQLIYLSGHQSKREYIQQFYDGNIDQHLKKWHHLDE